MKTAFSLFTVLLVLAVAAATSNAGPCDLPESHQFDFWVGDWEVHAKGRIVGRNHISRILDGCTLLEEYETRPRPYEGKSFNWYDPSDGGAAWQTVFDGLYEPLAEGRVREN